jgi:UDP:flavonoid glycosyltransferase YjiC (YdhE family)
VPVLCTPTHLEQEIGAQLIQQLGIGDAIFYRKYKPEEQVLTEVRESLGRMILFQAGNNMGASNNQRMSERLRS